MERIKNGEIRDEENGANKKSRKRKWRKMMERIKENEKKEFKKN